MQFIDLKKQQDRIRGAIEENIRKVLDHGQYILGPEVAELEERLTQDEQAILGRLDKRRMSVHGMTCVLRYLVRIGARVFVRRYPFFLAATVERRPVQVALGHIVRRGGEVEPVTVYVDFDKRCDVVIAGRQVCD